MKLLTDINNITDLDTIYIHEDHRDWFYKQFPAHPPLKTFELAVDPLWGLDIRFVPYVPKWITKWEFPYTPFVEYELSDVDWARPLGFGREVDTDWPALWVVSKPIIFHSNYLIPFKLPKYTILS